jgi:hypothetical protein
MSITPSKPRCERKLREIQELKQKGNNTDEELEKMGYESYYRNIMERAYTGEVIQATMVPSVCPVAESVVMVRCNHNHSVYRNIHTGKKYIIELPDINTILYVTCTFAACRAADMYIDMAVVNGHRDHDSETCTISYNYDNFDSIYYTSFNKPDSCFIYMC